MNNSAVDISTGDYIGHFPLDFEVEVPNDGISLPQIAIYMDGESVAECNMFTCSVTLDKPGDLHNIYVIVNLEAPYTQPTMRIPNDNTFYTARSK